MKKTLKSSSTENLATETLLHQLQSENDELELGEVTNDEAYEMLERSDHMAHLRAHLKGNDFPCYNEKISAAIRHHIDLNRREKPLAKV